MPQTQHSVPKGEERITLKEFVESKAAHGIGRVASPTQFWLRIFWAIIFLTAFAVFLWQSIFLFIRFFDDPKTVDVKVISGCISVYIAAQTAQGAWPI